jgi:signal transduction histidine kinase
MTCDPIKLLIVDDVEENRIVLDALLRREGLEILMAASGPEALELLLLHEVALALLDVQMPEMDGFELAELMRGAERTKHVPIIFVTAGSRDPQRVFRGYEKGAVDFLFKPIDAHMLKSKVDVFLELFRQKKELANALRLNEMFVGILGHDLRNPLNTIVMGAQRLDVDLTDQGSLTTVRRMLSASERMTAMIEQLLDLTRARLANGVGFVAAREPVTVGDLVQRTAEELRGAHPEREILVEVSGDSATSGDADRLLQVFSNLMANAVIHGAAGSPIGVSVHSSELEVAVRVLNKGTIASEILPTMFDPFRGRQAAGSKSRGLGLGLFISQQIAAAHGGSVSVESAEATGTIFTVRLPRSPTSKSTSG